MRAITALFLLLLLAGCWGGESFYPVSAARPALAPGLYTMTGVPGGDDGPARIEVTLQPDGLTRIGQAGDAGDFTVWGFAPLDDEGRLFVGWIARIGDGPARPDWALYGMLSREGDGSYRLLIPNCADTRELAEQAGARFEAHSDTPACVFPDRTSLETALRRLAATDAPAIRLTPLTRQ